MNSKYRDKKLTKGNLMRIDTTLVGYENLSWIRGNISLILNDKKLVIIDRDAKIIQQVWPRDFSISDEDIELEISVSLNTPIHALPKIHWDQVLVSRLKTGFLFKVR